MSDRLFEYVFILGLVAISLIRAPHIQEKRTVSFSTARDRRRQHLWLTLSYIAMQLMPPIYVFTSWLDFANYARPQSLGWAGIGVLFAALWLFWRSHRDLGRNWSVEVQVSREHSLVTQGVYRYLRHPMYAAFLLWGVAQALLLPNLVAGPSMLATFVPLYISRVDEEENMMLERFGDEYQTYMGRTGRIVPRLWGR